MVILDWQTSQILWKAALKYATVDSGGQYADVDGMTLMLLLLAGSWDFLALVLQVNMQRPCLAR